MKQIHYLTLALVVLLISSSAMAQTTIKGHVVDEQGKSVEYVTIGFENDRVGVISDAQGYFEITIPADRKDSLSFSHVSYLPAMVPYTVYSKKSELTVTMHSKVVELNEVVVGKKNRPRTLSGKSWVNVGVVAFIGNDNKYSEWGPVFKNRKDYLLSDIILSLKECTFEQCTLSFNVYEIHGNQFVNILNKPIYQIVSPADNDKQIAVSPSENIILKGKQQYCISVSPVNTKGKGAIYFSATFRSSFVRNSVKGKLRKMPICPAIVVKGCEI
jgi:hypothetical protein